MTNTMKTVAWADTIKFDPDDLDGMREIMDNYADCDMLFGENENGEHTQMSIGLDSISVSTLQNNGRTRTNTYYRDGSSEETFD